jgi:hypothetical protein
VFACGMSDREGDGRRARGVGWGGGWGVGVGSRLSRLCGARARARVWSFIPSLPGRRHACTVIFSSFVSTTEVQPRLGLDHDTTLQKLWEDAHAWRLEHNVAHSATQSPCRARPAGAAGAAAAGAGGPAQSACAPAPFPAPAAPEGYSDSEEVAPSGAAGGFKAAPRRGRSPPPPPDMIRGAGGAGGAGAAVDVGRPAEQSTEMFRSLRSVAMQLEQVRRRQCTGARVRRLPRRATARGGENERGNAGQAGTDCCRGRAAAGRTRATEPRRGQRPPRARRPRAPPG